uniref:Uncharacterized protein n=1 Tax=Anguilla anguilla TaxID=7936 RepID=A0A0E9QD95_ANGAN
MRRLCLFGQRKVPVSFSEATLGNVAVLMYTSHFRKRSQPNETNISP